MAATPIGGLPGCSMTPSHGGAGASAMVALMLLAFALLRRRRSAS
jgi:MYXO-CTERM domain-containing protein